MSDTGLLDFQPGEILPVSIGTAMALESFLRLRNDHPPHPHGAGKINQLHINLATLVRNFYASMTRDNAETAAISDVGLQLVEELAYIRDAVQRYAHGACQVEIYYNDLSELDVQFPYAPRKRPHTDRQIAEERREQICLAYLLQLRRTEYCHFVDRRARPTNQPVTVAYLTHYPLELLWGISYQELFLLESHTGKLKKRLEWSSKLTGFKSDAPIPFNRLTLLLFGDNTIFSGLEPKYRRLVKQVAEQRNWTKITPPERIERDIMRYGSPELIQQLMKLHGRK